MAAEQPTVSVIVPVCDVEAYLEECIDSVLEQTHALLEVILVDDGSTDGSGLLCDAFADRDFRVSLHRRYVRWGHLSRRDLGRQ